MGGILGSAVLDVAIGLVFVYLMLALLCTTINEWLAGILQSRGKTLLRGITALLGNQGHAASTGASGFLQLFKNHPLIRGLGDDQRPPSYIAPATFAMVVMDIAKSAPAGVQTFADLQSGVSNLPDGDVKKALLTLLQDAGNDIKTAQQRIEDWFNEYMDRVTGWYKRRVQIITVVLAVGLCGLLNADSIRIVKTLWADSTVRSAIVEQAKTQAAKPGATPAEADKAASDAARDALSQVLGWEHLPSGTKGWLELALGIALSAAATSLGAPFWFDILKRFVSLRTSGTSPAERAAQNPKSSG